MSSHMNTGVAILITGSRDWTDGEYILEILKPYAEHDKVVFIHGACRGADILGDAAAKCLGFTIISMPANWKKHGSAAGPIRNREMCKTLKQYEENGYSCVVMAFHPCLSRSKGTKNCVAIAEKMGFDVEIYTGE